ncbi:hypothetical protein RM780_07250 [Streptomyces sp. DSM 44917]|uniref:Aromatic ring-opening dioxygenase LigA n=1 Tax=Streptomyces boetiae TaxID=3075541 RepID=A0ABU2L677_9ACTN|nr:hypothetical protein [Streptomyces sp. DSM 44917]MDT0306758.1 hypothetical protein [Streptomyces sp. DSM 44917]
MRGGRPRRSRPGARPLLRALAIASCVPYLALKVAWLCGSHVGIPPGSELRSPDGAATLAAANALTAAMDACVIVLAFALTRPWGRRLPAWLLLLPLWAATGLLAPIVTGYPVSLAVGLLTDAAPAGGQEGEDAFLAPWVFGLVYGGFGVQALALGGLFALYIRDRWGHLLAGRLTAPPASRAWRAAAVATAALATATAVPDALWLAGSTAGLAPEQADGRDVTFFVTAVFAVLFAAAAAGGALLTAFRPRRLARLPLPGALAAAWTGSAALAAWGGWLLLAATLTRGTALPGERIPAVTLLSYAGQVLAGTLILALGARLLAARAAARPGASRP